MQERPIELACAEEIDEGELSDHQASGGQNKRPLRVRKDVPRRFAM